MQILRQSTSNGTPQLRSTLMRIVVLHQNRLFRQCLTAVLKGHAGFTAVEVDHEHPDRLHRIQAASPDVVLVDLNLAGGLALELTRQIHRLPGDVKVLLLASGNSVHEIARCVEAGALGCIVEESSLTELTDAVETVGRGEAYCSPQVARSIFAECARLAHGRHWSERAGAARLTARELEVLQLVAEGLGNKQIARRLSVSLYTVKNHVHNILEKLQAHDRFEAVELARRQPWFPDHTGDSR
jgi:DNA-binding NarL/FixJ family response regulator